MLHDSENIKGLTNTCVTSRVHANIDVAIAARYSYVAKYMITSFGMRYILAIPCKKSQYVCFQAASYNHIHMHTLFISTLKNDIQWSTIRQSTVSSSHCISMLGHQDN